MHMMYAPVYLLGPTMELLQCAAVAFTGSISESRGLNWTMRPAPNGFHFGI